MPKKTSITAIPDHVLSAVRAMLSPYCDTSSMTSESLLRAFSIEDESLLTKREAAAILRCSPMTVWRLGKEGRLDVRKRGHSDFAVTKSSVMRMVSGV